MPKHVMDGPSNLCRKSDVSKGYGKKSHAEREPGPYPQKDRASSGHREKVYEGGYPKKSGG